MADIERNSRCVLPTITTFRFGSLCLYKLTVGGQVPASTFNASLCQLAETLAIPELLTTVTLRYSSFSRILIPLYAYVINHSYNTSVCQICLIAQQYQVHLYNFYGAEGLGLLSAYVK